mmetsp:Transcript_20999/g.59588  ORF Transcript_20999/g.59588 Transcript_20999/m.59588 type:complete len:219 (+) Transcript_20999:1009-1665(+)
MARLRCHSVAGVQGLPPAVVAPRPRRPPLRPGGVVARVVGAGPAGAPELQEDVALRASGEQPAALHQQHRPAPHGRRHRGGPPLRGSVGRAHKTVRDDRQGRRWACAQAGHDRRLGVDLARAPRRAGGERGARGRRRRAGQLEVEGDRFGQPHGHRRRWKDIIQRLLGGCGRREYVVLYRPLLGSVPVHRPRWQREYFQARVAGPLGNADYGRCLRKV